VGILNLFPFAFARFFFLVYDSLDRVDMVIVEESSHNTAGIGAEHVYPQVLPVVIRLQLP
jgi:hypothetical protein